MAKQNVSEYDVIASGNSDIGGNNITGTGLVSTADDSFRANSANLAKWWSDLGGVNTVAGTGDAITITTPTVYTALKTGMRFNFKASAANTGAATLNFDAIGAKAVRKISGGTDIALTAGDIPGAGARIDLIYDATANAAAGAWIFAVAPPASLTFATPTQTVTGMSTTLATNPDGVAFAISGYATTATAAGTTTLTAGSGPIEFFTGTTTQTVVLPVTSTLVLGRTFRVVNNSTGNVTVQSSGANAIAILAGGASGLFTCILTSGTTAASWEFRPVGITLGTAVASTSGTSIDFTGIPAWAKRVTVNFTGVSSNGTSIPIVQIGDSGGIETSGYIGATGSTSGGGTGVNNIGSGFTLAQSNSAATIRSGKIVLDLLAPSTNTWAAAWSLGRSDAGVVDLGAGSKPLSATLDRVRITMENGTDAFDAGSINISYE